MTLADLLGALARRWYVVVVVCASGGMLFAWLSASGGVYSSEPVIAFAFPGARIIEPDNGVADEDVIAFALAVGEAVNNGRPVERYAAADAPLYGAGARQQVQVSVPNAGGQWGISYTRAEIVVSIVGHTREWVQQTQDETIQNVFAVAAREQDLHGVPANRRITPSVLPLSTRIEYIGAGGTQRLLALGALAAATALVAGWAAVTWDRAARALSARRGVDGGDRGAAERPVRSAAERPVLSVAERRTGSGGGRGAATGMDPGAERPTGAVIS
ncbi:hypothetical protein [Microbacterium luticocti]|uniref:hypothetical protein n=1 Tax=Microbacterium luticocti TaxID=451764 RepID=UPI000427F32A|nr:hypothetical protein [Microbacterium luticocti]